MVGDVVMGVAHDAAVYPPEVDPLDAALGVALGWTGCADAAEVDATGPADDFFFPANK